MKPIAILAIGQGAANIAAEFAKRGYLTGAINTCEQDLQAVAPFIPNRLPLVGEGGAGKNRAIGFEAIKHNAKQITDFLARHFDDPELKALQVVFTLGGGTGGGGGPAVAGMAAAMLSLTVNPVVVLPDDTEADNLRFNAVEAFAEVSRIENVGATVVIDNERGRKLLGGRDYGRINRMYAETIDEVLGLTGLVSAEVNFDKRELFDLWAEPGMLTIIQAELGREETRDPLLLIGRSATEAIFAEPNEARKLGLIVQASSQAVAHDVAQYVLSLYDPLPPVVHQGIYVGGNRITLIHAGQAWPMARLKAVETSLVGSIGRVQKEIQAYRPEGLERNPFTSRRTMPTGERASRVQEVLAKLERK